MIIILIDNYCHHLRGKNYYCWFSESSSQQELISPLSNLVSDRYGHLTSVILVE